MMSRLALVLTVFVSPSLLAESGIDAWLRYAVLDEAAARPYRDALPAFAASFGDSPVTITARQELLRGIRGMLGRTLRVASALPQESAILLGTIDDLRRAAPQIKLDTTPAPDGFWLRTVRAGTTRYTVIA